MHNKKQREFPGSPVVRSLVSTAEGLGSIPSQGTNIPKAVRPSQKKKKNPPENLKYTLGSTENTNSLFKMWKGISSAEAVSSIQYSLGINFILLSLSVVILFCLMFTVLKMDSWAVLPPFFTDLVFDLGPSSLII